MFRTSVSGVGRAIGEEQVESPMIKFGQMEPLIFLARRCFYPRNGSSCRQILSRGNAHVRFVLKTDYKPLSHSYCSGLAQGTAE